MSISSKLTLILNTKTAIRLAIESQGITITTSTPFSDYARLISIIGKTAPLFTTQPSISGSPSLGFQLTANEGIVTGNPAPTLSIVWLRDGVATTNTGLTYLLTEDDLGSNLSVRVTATNIVTNAQETSNSIGPIIEIVEPTWTQERAITVNNTSGPVSDYQTLVTLNSSNFNFAAAQSDGKDLRFTDTDKTTLLPYWIESYNAISQTARVWVRTLLPGGTSKTIYLYSANADVGASTANGDGVFEFFDDFAGVPGWNRYKITNPVIKTAGSSWKSDIVGDPMVIAPDAATNEWGAYYFGATGSNGGIGYMRSLDNGVTWIDGPSNPVMVHGGTNDNQFAIKPSVFYDGGVYHMAYAGKSASTGWRILYATATNRNGPWTKQGILLTGNGSSHEGDRLDCPCWFRDLSGTVRLYYSGGEAIANEPYSFCLATSANFAGPFTRHANNPLAIPNANIPWANNGLGGMSVRQISANLFDIAYNAFSPDGISKMGRTTSTDGITINLQASDLLFDLGPSGAWDRVKLYRPCIYNTGTGPDRLLYNALGDTENIGYAELTKTFNSAKWTPNLQGDSKLDWVNGRMTIGETRASNPGAYFTLNTTYIPANDTILETRLRMDTIHETQFSEFAPFIFGSGLPFAGGANSNHFLFLTKFSNTVRHQNRNNGGWGDEDIVYAQYPTLGTDYRYRVVKKSASMDYLVQSDVGAVLGSIVGNTDAPQGASLPLSLGTHGATGSFDFMMARKYLAVEPTVSVGNSTTVAKTGLG